MHSSLNPAQMPSAADLIETWLAGQIAANVTVSSASQHSRDAWPRLPQQTGSERLASIREVLDRQPSIARYARHLSVPDQLRLTIEMLRGIRPSTGDLAASPVEQSRSIERMARTAVKTAQRTSLCQQPHRVGRPRFAW